MSLGRVYVTHRKSASGLKLMIEGSRPVIDAKPARQTSFDETAGDWADAMPAAETTLNTISGSRIIIRPSAITKA